MLNDVSNVSLDETDVHILRSMFCWNVCLVFHFGIEIIRVDKRLNQNLVLACVILLIISIGVTAIACHQEWTYHSNSNA